MVVVALRCGLDPNGGLPENFKHERFGLRPRLAMAVCEDFQGD
jgi:hypothetical protein